MYVKRNKLGLIIDRRGDEFEGFVLLPDGKEKDFYLDDANRADFDSIANDQNKDKQLELKGRQDDACKL